MKALNARQDLFVSAYIGEAKCNATEAARTVGYKQPQLAGWRLMQIDAVRAAVVERLAAVKADGIAQRQNRIDALNDRWQRMQQVIDERADDPAMQHIPGGKTGLLVRQWKKVGSGEDAELVEEYSVDTGLLKEMREHEKQAAIELKQWNEKADSGALAPGLINFNVTVTEAPRGSGS